MLIKLKISFIVVLLLCIPAFGQIAGQVSDSSGITVMNQSWKFVKKVIFVKQKKLSEQKEEDRMARAALGGGAQAQKELASGKSVTVPRQSTEGLNAADVGKTTTVSAYHYKMTLKNDSRKIISEITWQYVFFDRTTKKELGRRQFTSRQTIRSGDKKAIDEQSSLPPTNIIVADSTGTKYTGQYIEEIQIKSIKYSDGSIWEHTNL